MIIVVFVIINFITTINIIIIAVVIVIIIVDVIIIIIIIIIIIVVGVIPDVLSKSLFLNCFSHFSEIQIIENNNNCPVTDCHQRLLSLLLLFL